jgi:hypothetical protein
VSTWEVPTEAAPTVPSPGNTPAQHQNPFPAPHDAQGQATRGVDGPEGERGLGVCRRMPCIDRATLTVV